MAAYRHVVSRDGTRIAYRVEGHGRPLVLVHGTRGSDLSWRFVEPLLAARFTLYLMQRRGRGESGDGPTYSLPREAEDVAGVAGSIECPVALFGHSFGATCALEASLFIENLRKLVLYEPAVEIAYAEGSIERQEQLVAEGRHEELIELVMKGGGSSPRKSGRRSGLPPPGRRVSRSHGRSRGGRARTPGTRSRQSASGAWFAPALLLLGSESGDEFRYGIDQVQAALPDARVAMLDGQGHAATLTAPDPVADVVSTFLEA